MYPPRRIWGFGDTPGAPTLVPTPDQAVLNGLNQQLADRMARIEYLKQVGEPFWLPINLGLPASAAPAGNTYPVTSANQDFDLLIIGAECTIALSTIEIIDSARNRAITNGTVPPPAIAQVVKGTTVITFPFDWTRPYFLPAKAQLKVVTTADGTETGGVLTLRCLMPPNYQG